MLELQYTLSVWILFALAILLHVIFGNTLGRYELNPYQEKITGACSILGVIVSLSHSEVPEECTE